LAVQVTAAVAAATRTNTNIFILVSFTDYFFTFSWQLPDCHHKQSVVTIVSTLVGVAIAAKDIQGDIEHLQSAIHSIFLFIISLVNSLCAWFKDITSGS